MAAVAAQVGVSRFGGFGLLPDRRMCSYLPAESGNCFQRSVSRHRTLVARSLKSKRIAAVFQEDEGVADSKLFRSMSEVAERRKEDAVLASFDAVETARAVSDAEVLTSSRQGRTRAVQPPRFATLRAFGEAGGEGVVTGEFEGTSLFELIAASIEASKQVKSWEVLSGRLAMLALSGALGVEIFTGHSVFSGIDSKKLEAVAVLCAVATSSAAAFAYAWRAKADVVTLMSKSYKNMLESALDNVIDGLFFDEL